MFHGEITIFPQFLLQNPRKSACWMVESLISCVVVYRFYMFYSLSNHETFFSATKKRNMSGKTQKKKKNEKTFHPLPENGPLPSVVSPRFNRPPASSRSSTKRMGNSSSCELSQRVAQRQLHLGSAVDVTGRPSVKLPGHAVPGGLLVAGTLFQSCTPQEQNFPKFALV